MDCGGTRLTHLIPFLSNSPNDGRRRRRQYCRSGGLPELVQALARHYSPLYGRELDANTEITVSVGVSEVCH